MYKSKLNGIIILLFINNTSFAQNDVEKICTLLQSNEFEQKIGVITNDDGFFDDAETATPDTQFLNVVDQFYDLKRSDPFFVKSEAIPPGFDMMTPEAQRTLKERVYLKTNDGKSHSKDFDYVRIHILKTLKRYPYLIVTANRSLLYHGSTSASLLDLTKKTSDDSEDTPFLIPTGKLLDTGRAPLAGTFDLGLMGVNKVAISTIFIGDGFSKIFEYAHSVSQEETCAHTDYNTSFFEGQLKTMQQWIQYLEHNKDGQELIKDDFFPIIYGIRPFESRPDEDYQIVNSDVKGEMAIVNGFAFREIQVIYAPSEKINLVERLIHHKYPTTNVKVHDINLLKSIKLDDVCIPQGNKNKGIKNKLKNIFKHLRRRH